MQEFLHDPPRYYGDCHRAALASLLDLPAAKVPHFMHGLGPDDGLIFNRLQDDWLASRGLACIVFPIGIEDDDIPRACKSLSSWNPDKLFLLGGSTRGWVGHSVVADKTGIIHDPHPSKLGLERPMRDGFYWVTYIVGKLYRHS